MENNNISFNKNNYKQMFKYFLCIRKDRTIFQGWKCKQMFIFLRGNCMAYSKQSKYKYKKYLYLTR